MSKKRAIRICWNLQQTISRIPADIKKEYIFDPPQVKKGVLVKKLNDLMKKYKISLTDISTHPSR